MAEKLCTLRTKGGGGGKYTETSLWTNQSPTNSFSTQTVTLSQGMSNYKYLKIVHRISAGNATENTTIYPVDDLKRTGNGTYVPLDGLLSKADATYSRSLYYVSDTSITFSTSYKVSNATANDNTNIPLEILGLNELDHGTKYTTNASEIAFKSVSANTIPTFTTVAEAKAIWLTINYTSAYRALQITNVNPTTGEVNNNSLYKIDTNSLGNIEPLTGNKFIVTSNSVTMQSAPSTAATQQSLIYTY